jgi:hypothetical protein
MKKKTVTTQEIRKDSKRIAILWQDPPESGRFEVINGTVAAKRVITGNGVLSGDRFALETGKPARLELEIDQVKIDPGAYATLVTVHATPMPFTFFLRDVNPENPIYIPELGVAVTAAGDRRDFSEIVESIRVKGLLSGMERFQLEPEESFENACRRNRDLMCPTWLGLGRDMRLFRVSHSPEFGYWGTIEPVYHSVGQSMPETENKPYRLSFCIGPGSSCQVNITRRLDDGVLPILHAEQREGDVIYRLTAFATLETQTLKTGAVRGTHWKAAYPNTGGNMLTPGEKDENKEFLEAEMHGREEEVVACVRVEALNTSGVPRYAWFKALHLDIVARTSFDGLSGFSSFESGRVFGIQKLQGQPMPQEEMAVLIQPGEVCVFDMLVPHQPIPIERASKLANLDYEANLAACRAYWQEKLSSGGRIHVPEAAVDERIRAGLLHCDLAALGLEPDGEVLATIGWYSPIGSESSPIIQFFDSMGWHKLAERSLEFFLSRQREDGFIQNFGGYQLETGPVLWSMGEHYRYTRDEGWVRRVKPNVLKACEYLLNWRERNKGEELRGAGYGLMDGKVADPEDYFHSFMLNGLSYLGIQRAAEMLENVDPGEAARLATEAAAFRKDIRQAFYESMGRSPVVPLGNGTWAPTVPPWAEYRGPVGLFAEGGNWFTHGTFLGRDSLIGALYLVISEVLEPDEIGTDFMLKSHQELCTVENAGLSQPYYVRHDYAHLLRREAKAFLKTYYNQFTALQDRETYTFWEHYFHASQHKTHEEGWFLMQTRWMLWLERGDSLWLLAGVPRRWLEDGKKIVLEDVTSYFGKISLHLESSLAQGRIEARLEVSPLEQTLRSVRLRIPHPEGRKPRLVSGGIFDTQAETVQIDNFQGTATVVLDY